MIILGFSRVHKESLTDIWNLLILLDSFKAMCSGTRSQEIHNWSKPPNWKLINYLSITKLTVNG